MSYLLVLVSASASICGNLMAKFWAEQRGMSWTMATAVFYTISTLTYVWSLRLAKFTIVNAFFYALVPIFTIFTGYFLFREKLTTLQLVGIAVTMLGIVLFSFEEGLSS